MLGKAEALDLSSTVRGLARAAIERGSVLLSQGDRACAARWFERAQRLAPDDPSGLFLLASALSTLDPARSLSLLDNLLGVSPSHRSGCVARVAVLRHLGSIDAAAHALDDILCNFAAPADPAFARLADCVASQSGHAGWVGLSGDGELVGSARDLRVVLDDTALPPMSRPSRLPAAWRSAATLRVTPMVGTLLGTTISIASINAVEGVVDLTPDGLLSGWACKPHDPEREVSVDLFAGDDALPFRTLAVRGPAPAWAGADGIMPIRGFETRFAASARGGAIHARVDGVELRGSPALHGVEARAARLANRTRKDPWRPLPAALVAAQAAARKTIPARADIDVILPLYRGVDDFACCLADILIARLPNMRIVAIDDGIAEPALRASARAAASRGELILLSHDRNRGFPAAVNTGLDHAAGRDVIILNADTRVPPGAWARLADAAYADPSIGTVTPLTTDGTITTCRSPGQTEPVMSREALLARDAAARHANPHLRVPIPTCVGFCTYIRHDCLREVGRLREDVFAQGYGEENDFSLRAAQLGWTHVAACDTVVAHAGGRSFGAARLSLLARNLHALNRLHPGYDALVASFVKADTLRPARQAIARREWSAGRKAAATVLVTHDAGGGVERHIRQRAAALARAGLRAIVVRPGDAYALSDGASDAGARLDLADAPSLAAFLAADNPISVELHHTAGHTPGIETLGQLLGIPTDIFVHDFAAICPQITLCGPSGRYCGEPLDTRDCDHCVEDLGSQFPLGASVADLRAGQAEAFGRARRVVAPSRDAARRLGRYMPSLDIVVQPWEDDGALARTVRLPARPAGDGTVHVGLVGSLGMNKGYAVLLACARDARRRGLPLTFTVVGQTVDDGRLLATGHVFVTGRYKEGEAQDLLRAASPHIGLLPSVWPETWCYALSELWRAGLHVVAFDLGSQAERIKARGAGSVLPLNVPAAVVNDHLLRVIPTSVQTDTREGGRPSFSRADSTLKRIKGSRPGGP